MPMVKSVGGMSARQAEELVDRQADDLADEIVERDVEGAFGRPVAADRIPSMPDRPSAQPALVEGRGSPIASSSSGITVAIVSGVSP